MTSEQTSEPARSKATWKTWAIGAGLLLGIAALFYAYLFVTTPAAVRFPRVEHAHVRMQLLVDGKAVNFGEDKFQTQYAQACSDNIPSAPIHFHDSKDQFVHLHWKGVTGGLILKEYGWNLVGGTDNTLGYRFDHAWPEQVQIHGNDLPTLPGNANLWVYTGDETNHRERDLADFLYQDIEAFLGKQSTVNQQAWLDSLFFKKASAHGDEVHDETRLAKINNLLGNIVVFAQKDRPRSDEVTERFKHLEPLSESTCGG